MIERIDAEPPPYTREWIAEWTAVGSRFSAQREPIEPVHMRRAAAEVVRRLGDLESKVPPTYELDETVRRLTVAWKESGALGDVEPRHLRRAPWAFFHPKDRPGGWLGRDGALVRAWLRWLADEGRARSVVAMLRAFLDAYPTGLQSFDAIRQAVQERLRAVQSPRTMRWLERCDRFGLLEFTGPERLVDSWFAVDVDCDTYLSEAGLSGGLESSAFVRRSSEQLLRRVESELLKGRSSAAICDRAFTWLERQGQLRFPELKVEVANAFLRPFVEKVPSETTKAAIQAFLCRTVGDPRINRPRWNGVPDEVRNVLLRWLVGASLDDFFRVLDQTALDRHWRHRKAFWTAYLQREAIDDAWVVLGSEAARIVQGGLSAGAAKLVSGGGVQGNQSVLLMRIKGVTIAEWSHNGSFRMWRRGNGEAPKLYETAYTRSQLIKGCDVSQTHHGAELGTWQGKVAALIASETGIRNSSSSYMPRPWRR